MPTFTPRLAVVLVALSAMSTAAPLAAQGTPAPMATVYLKEGGVIHGQILNENDPNGVRIKSAKSGTVFLLKTVWIDSIVKAPSAPPAPVQPAPAQPTPSTPPTSLVSAPAASTPPSAPPTVATTTAPAPSAPLPAKPVVAAPVVDALDPPPAQPVSAPAAKPTSSKGNAEKKPAKFSHWYVGGGGSAPTGEMGDVTDIGYSGMLAYASGVGKMTQLRLGGAGNYWSASTGDANFYDVTGTFDVLVGKRIPGFLAPYGLLGGVGGVRNTSPPPGFVGYARNPLYGARVGAGLNSRRIFLEVSYQKVWVDGTSSGYVPFVFGFRF